MGENMSYTTNCDMLDEVRRHSDPACDYFYRTYMPLIRLHGRDCGVPDSDLDDLVQIVMMEFFRDDRFTYDAKKGSFRGYLRKIIHSRSMDLLRRRYRDKRNDALSSDGDEMFLDQRYNEEWLNFIRDEAMRRLRCAVSPEHFQQFFMLAIQHRSVKEVARFYDARTSTIYSSCRRTRIVLEKIVRDIEQNAR